jgi:hypothetical protein
MTGWDLIKVGLRQAIAATWAKYVPRKNCEFAAATIG